MGSLIKSPGGTIVTGGGYIAGRADLVAAAGARMNAPGVGLDAGAVPGETLRLMFQGANILSPKRGRISRPWTEALINASPCPVLTIRVVYGHAILASSVNPAALCAQCCIECAVIPP